MVLSPRAVFNTGVAHISRSRTITADPQTVWAVLADFGALSSWADGVDHSSLLWPSEHPVGLARRVQMGRTTVIERIVEFDPHTALAYDIEGMPKLVRHMRNRWELRPAGTESTAVTLTTTVDIGLRPLERVVCLVAAQQSEKLLAGLAAQCKESRVV